MVWRRSGVIENRGISQPGRMPTKILKTPCKVVNIVPARRVVKIASAPPTITTRTRVIGISATPRIEPTAPMSFTSPAPIAPKMCNSSIGINATPRPKALFPKPCHPPNTVLIVRPAMRAVSTSMFGMRR